MASSARSRFDPQPPDRGDGSIDSLNKRDSNGALSTMAAEAEAPEEFNLLHILGSAITLSKDYQIKTVERSVARSYRAWQNQHAEGSKYLGTAWRGRSRLFVPKTRSAIRKNLATAAGALFSTEDVVNISATFEDDPQQRATASVLKADLDFRLTRASTKSGLPWFHIAMGGCLDGQLTGCTISKQYWEYEEVESGEYEAAMVPLTDEETGETVHEIVTDPETGEEILDDEGMPILAPVMVEGSIPKMRVNKDRPMVDLIPIENVGMDPAAPWYDPVQLGRWFYVRYPMGLSDVKAMMKSGGKPGANGAESGWLENVPDELLLKGRIEEDRSGGRRVREGGGDRYEDARAPGELDIVWIQENFIRVAGVDYHFWSVGRHGYISKVRRVWQSYPELDGERPYVMGVSQLDTHRVFPMSPAESWQPLQLEINDVVNLRQDTLKRAIAPLAVVKRGKNVDLTQVQRRGQPDAMLLVDSADDVTFTPTPGPTGAAYTEVSATNSWFDELAGVFSTSSVQSNRQLNETVGGMRLMSGAANAVSEFDLRMWVETWVERVLRQLVHLVRYNESDEKILGIAGQRARVWDRFSYMPNLSDFEQTEVVLRVNCGIGALDPMQRLAKLKMAGEMLAPLAPQMQAKGITPNIEAFIEEIMGHAGFKNGRRFFDFGDPPPPQPDPETQIKQAEIEAEFKRLMAELQSEESRNHEDNQTKLLIEQMRGRQMVAREAIGVHANREARAHSDGAADKDRRHRIHELLAGKAGGRSDRAPAPQEEVPDTSAPLIKALSQMQQRQQGLEQALKLLMMHMMAGAQQQPGAGRPPMMQGMSPPDAMPQRSLTRPAF